MDQPIQNSSQIEADLRTVVGGYYSVDHLGHEMYEAVRQRVRENAHDYLDLFEQAYFGAKFDAMAHSDLQLAAFLRLVADLEPERVRTLASQLVRQYDATLVVYDSVADKEKLRDLISEDMMRLTNRLDRQRTKLRELAG